MSQCDSCKNNNECKENYKETIRRLEALGETVCTGYEPKMTYREFRKWYVKHVFYGPQCVNTAMMCVNVIRHFSKIPFWKREKEWRKFDRENGMSIIVERLNLESKRYE